MQNTITSRIFNPFLQAMSWDSHLIRSTEKYILCQWTADNQSRKSNREYECDLLTVNKKILQ